ncbi:MAG: dienelactone hydrolase family protein [Acidobacteria bacterium]|nr:dienelactone hydrolase family protein [Acidobacteriota bacterium]
MKSPRVADILFQVCLLSFTVVVLVCQAASAQSQPPRVRVTFQTEDGWTIVGTLFMPREAATIGRVPGVVILSEPAWVPRMIHGANIAAGVKDQGMAALTIDMRGSAASVGKKDYQLFSEEDRDGMQLDIRAAVKFLSSQKGVDPGRIGVLGAGDTAEYVVREAAKNLAQIKAVVLITGAYTEKSKQAIKSLKDLPVLATVGNQDPKDAQTEAATPYFLSQNKYSRLILGMDRGAAMFNRPGRLKEQVSEWLRDNLKGLGTETELSFTSDDGWKLNGKLYMPDVADGTKVPGVVFVHGHNHDQQTWYYLAREATRGGMASLIFDWRGNRKSIRPDGKWEFGVDLPQEEWAKLYLDIKAAIQLIASQKQVDPNRIGLVGATATNNPAVKAMIGDPRIKTFVGLSFYTPDAETKKFVASSDVPFLVIASTNDMNADGGSLADGTREVYRLSKSKQSSILMYDDAGRGSDMLKTKQELFGIITRWLQEKLGITNNNGAA